VQASLTGHLVSPRCTRTTHPARSPASWTWVWSHIWSPRRSKPCWRNASFACYVRTASTRTIHRPPSSSRSSWASRRIKRFLNPSVAVNAATPAFFGRHAIFEWMDTDEEIRQLILKSASTDQIRNAARRGGMRTLAEDGWRAGRRRRHTVEEVLSVTTAKEVEGATKMKRRQPPRASPWQDDDMPTFSYRALQAGRQNRRGRADAPGRPDALREMESLGLRPVNLAENAARAKKARCRLARKCRFKFESKKVSGKELENFTRLLSSLLAAGVP